MKISHWIISTISILISAYLIPGVTTTILGAIIFAVVLGVINIFIKPIIKVLTLPITIVTLGLFSLVINATLIFGAAKIVPDFYVDGFLSAFFFSLLVSLINSLFLPRKHINKTEG